ncbi:MAG: nucleoside deaminase [Bacteroidales bacterium]|jgi:tRNA(adenine34) deaminase|nr:nucleoside deaminase [Bacteroidales bacterium]
MADNDEFFMREALKMANEAADLGEIPVGAVVVCNEKIIARCCNLTQQLNDATAHAEMQAFTAASSIAGKYLQNCTLYVTLEPCPMCLGAAFWTQIGRIVYGAADNRKIVKDKSQLLHPKTVIEGGVLEDECAELLNEFFRNKRN